MKELCDLLTCLEVPSLGSGKVIACLLTGKATKGKISKRLSPNMAEPIQDDEYNPLTK